MNNKEAVAILLANMSTAFAIDHEDNRIEDVTEHPEIRDMLSKGKFVKFHTSYLI